MSNENIIQFRRDKNVGRYLTACIMKLHEMGSIELQATGSAIEKLVRTVAKLQEMLDITVDEVSFEEVDFEQKKKARLRVKINAA